MAAVLFKNSEAVRLEETRETATDRECEWNKVSSSGVACKPIADIDFYSEKTKSRILSNNPVLPEEPRQSATEDDKSDLLTSLP